MLLALCVSAEAQQQKKVSRLGYLLNTDAATDSARYEAFRGGLRELGYVGGKNIVIEYRSSEGKTDRLPELVAELVRLKVDVIVATGPNATHAAKEATTTIPIVFTNHGDPVGTGVVASLAQPGGNITGLSTLVPELSGKRLELLKEVAPKLSRVAVLGTSTIRTHARFLKDQEPAAGALGINLQF
jgi:putative tryptophan/tyrosine transport system substrate-binding protein